MASAAVAKVGNYNIGDMIDYQRDCLRKRKYSVLGRVLMLRLGVDARAAYFQSDAWKRVMPRSKVMGLVLEWPESIAPWVGFAEDRQTLLFMNGIEHSPRVSATILRDLEQEFRDSAVLKMQTGKNIPRISQYITDYASGRIVGRDGWQFAVCQPVEQIAVLANTRSTAFGSNGTFLMLRGYAIDGRFPSLMTGFKGKGANAEHATYLMHGMMQFSGSESRREEPRPWLNP